MGDLLCNKFDLTNVLYINYLFHRVKLINTEQCYQTGFSGWTARVVILEQISIQPGCR